MQDSFKRTLISNQSPLDQFFRKNIYKNQIRFSSIGSRLPATPIAPFSNLTDEIRSFINERLMRDWTAIEQLDHTIQNNNSDIRDLYNGSDLTTNNDPQIARLNDLIQEDITVRQTYQQSADLLYAIYYGEEPPIHNMGAWLNIRNDLDNSEDAAIESLRDYVTGVINTNIRDQFVETIMAGRENLSETRSRANSQYSDEIDESDSSSESDSDVYQSADSNNDESGSSSESDSNDNPPGTGQEFNPNNNQSDGDNESNTNIDQSTDNHESNEYSESPVSNSDVYQSADQNESNGSSDKKLITDDALDISDTLHMFYDESSVKNQSTIDFVLQKQQEEMPDIMDSDGGE